MPNAIQCLRCCGTYVGGKLKLEGSRNPSDNSRSPCLAQNRRRGSSRSRKIEVEDGCGSPPESSSFTNPERGSPGSCTDQQSGSPFTRIAKECTGHIVAESKLCCAVLPGRWEPIVDAVS
jgi:hypothetical protein